MTNIRRTPISALLLMLAACNVQSDAMPGNNAGAPSQIPARSTRSASTDDVGLKKKLVGSWVTSTERPRTDAESLCATDAGILLDSDGTYDGFDESGNWAVKDGALVITATTSLDDSDTNKEEAEERPINPPRVIRWPIEAIDGDLAQMRSNDGKFWMFRCPISNGN